jgi:hypothetical protein
VRCRLLREYSQVDRLVLVLDLLLNPLAITLTQASFGLFIHVRKMFVVGNRYPDELVHEHIILLLYLQLWMKVKYGVVACRTRDTCPSDE